MFQEKESQTADNSMTIPYYDMLQEVYVMLVDQDQDTIDLLKSYDYKVRTVDMASTAISMLSKGKEKIDMIIINVNSSDLLSFQLLAQAVSLNIISLFVCDEQNSFLIKKALDIGAYLYLKKPLDKEIAKYLWQFVLRERIQREKAREENGDKMNSVGDEEQRGEKKNMQEQGNNVLEAIVSNENNLKKKKSIKEINEREIQSSFINKIFRKKTCTEWTMELHDKFMKAVEQLGEGRCYPNEILTVMNVPGLTRLQVASHLQKCRSNNWRAPEERKYVRRPLSQGSFNGSQQRNNYKKFGTIPHIQTNVPNQTQRNLKFSFPPLNNSFPTEENSTEHQVQPCHLSPFLSTQQEHRPIFEKFGSESLPCQIIRSTNYNPGLVFNSGDQNDYNNLDFNAAHRVTTTYPGMFDTNTENETISATNANFQQYIGDSNNIAGISHDNSTEESDANYDAYFNFNDMDYLFHNLESPSANLPNEHGSEFDQVYSGDINTK